MKNRLTVLLIVVSALLPLASWLMAAFGMEVRSLISEEGLRWLFRNGMQSAFTVDVQQFILLLLTVAALELAQTFCYGSQHRRRAVMVTAFAGVLMLASLVFLAQAHNSPLLTVSGQLLPDSPFLSGLPQLLILSVWMLTVLYVYANGRLTSLQRFVDLLTAGFGQYGQWMLMAMLCSFDYQVVKFLMQ